MATKPLAVFVIDAGEYEFIKQWAGEGYLPNINKIMQSGVWGEITDEKIIGEHGAGRSLTCGIPHDSHCYYYFRQLKPGTYEMQVDALRELCPKPFWAYLPGKVAVIDPIDTFIVEGLPGIQVNNWNKSQPNQRILKPESYPKEILDKLNAVCPVPKSWNALDLNATEQDEKRAMKEFLSRVEKKTIACKYIFAKDDYDFYFASFSEAHIAGHRFWDYMHRQEYQNHPLRNAIRDIYQKLDKNFGEMIAELPGDANICILSPHGLKDAYPTTLLMEDFCRKLGYQASPQTSNRNNRISLNPISLARKILPSSVRLQISQYLPSRIQDKMIQTAMRDSTDWSKTTVFSIPTLYTTALRVNLKGREPEGIVTPGTEYLEVLESLESDLKRLVDPITGESPVERIVRTVDCFGCPPHKWLPDIFVIWKPCAHFMSKLIHPKAELSQAKPEYYRSSYHSYHGFFAASGPSIKNLGNIGEISYFDVAPTLLALQNIDAPEQFVGKSVSDIISDQ